MTMFMKRIVFLVLFLVGLSHLTYSQTLKKQNKATEISICQPLLTDAGRQTTFHFNYIYRVVSDEKGAVKEVNELLDHGRFRGLMSDESVVPCIEKWKLEPSEKYIIVLSVGTAGDQFIHISSKTSKIKINL